MRSSDWSSDVCSSDLEQGLMRFLIQDKDARSIYKLYPGRTIEAGLNNDGSMAWLRYDHTPGSAKGDSYVSKWLEIKPDGQGGYTAAERTAAADTQIRVDEGQHARPLFGATDQTDIPDAATLQMDNILGRQVHFLKDKTKGRHFTVLQQPYTPKTKQ